MRKTFSAICVITITFISIVLFSGCQKELDFQTLSASTNSFTFTPSQDSVCMQYVLNGEFFIDSTLSNDNFVDISVTPTDSGSWQIGPIAQNGISFSGKGNFTDTLPTTIRLFASGTPKAVGDFNFEISASGTACKFTVSVDSANSTATPPIEVGTYYYKADINGKAYYQAETETNGFTAGSSLGGSDEVSFSASIDKDEPQLKGIQIAVTKQLMRNYLSATQSRFDAFFAPGKYPFAALELADGIIIEWYNEKNERYTTVPMAGFPFDQNGSEFEILSAAKTPTIIGHYIKVKMKFNCNLYHPETGEKLVLKNGEFVGVFGML